MKKLKRYATLAAPEAHGGAAGYKDPWLRICTTTTKADAAKRFQVKKSEVWLYELNQFKDANSR